MIRICEECYTMIPDGSKHCDNCNSCNIFNTDDLCGYSIIKLNNYFISNGINARTKWSCEGHFKCKDYIVYPYIYFVAYDESSLECIKNISNYVETFLIRYGLIEKTFLSIFGVDNIIFYDEFRNDYNYNLVFIPKTKSKETLVLYNAWKFELWSMINILVDKIEFKPVVC